MGKKEVNFETAEKLYVYEHMTIEAIAERLPVCERTLHYWKTEGDWDRKRCQYIIKRKSFHEEMFDLARELLHSAQEDVKENGYISDKKDLSIKRMISMIETAKKYESATEIEQKTSDSKEDIKAEDLVELMRKQVLGL